MTEERMKRLLTAFVSTGVILLVVLLTVLVFQMICLSQKNKELQALKEAEAEYLQIKENTEDNISLWLEEWKIEEAARKYGFRFEK